MGAICSPKVAVLMCIYQEVTRPRVPSILCRYMDNIYYQIDPLEGDVKAQGMVIKEKLTKLYQIPIQIQSLNAVETAFLEVKFTNIQGRWCTRLNCKYNDICKLVSGKAKFPLVQIGLPSGNSLMLNIRSVITGMFIRNLRYGMVVTGNR